jgi:cellulase/cellobiase CelA1
MSGQLVPYPSTAKEVLVGEIRSHRDRAGDRFSRILGKLPPKPIIGVYAVFVVLGAVLIQATDLGSSTDDSAKAVGKPSPATQPEPLDPSATPTVDPSTVSAQPTSEPPPSETPSPSPSAGPAALTATYVVTRSWDSGFVERVTITNHSARSQDWTVVLVLPAGVTVTSTWNATMRQNGRTVELTRPQGVSPLDPNASASFGFEAAGTGGQQQSCVINGYPCG